MSSHGARTARQQIVEACGAGHAQAALMAAISPLLAQVVPFDAAGWGACDPDTLLPTAFHTPNLPPEVAHAYLDNELLAADVNKLTDLVRHRRPAGLLSEATRGELERSPRYRTMMAPYGHERELRVPFVLDGRCWGSVCLVRDGARPDFSSAEVRWVAGLAKHVAHGLSGAAGSGDGRTAPDAVPEPDASGMLVVDDDCRVVHATPEAEAWLVALGAAERVARGDVPTAVRAVVARARACELGGGCPLPPRVRVRTGPQRWTVVQASRLSGPATLWAVVIETARPSEVLTLLAQAHGLTSREREVFAMLLRGLTDAEMAAALVVSLHTQREHVKRVLGKFEARNRTELVLRVYAERAEAAALR